MSWFVIGRNGIVTKQQGQSGNNWQVLFRLSALRKTPLYRYRYKYVHWKWAEIFPVGWNSGAILQKQPSLLAPQHQGHLAGRDIWSEPQLEKFYTDDVKSVRNLVSSSDWSAYLIFIHCIVLAIVYKQQTKDRQSQRSNVNVMNLLQISQCSWNIFCFRSSIWVLLAKLFSRRIQNITSNKFMITGFTSKHWFMSSVWNFCRWGADLPPSKTS